VRSLLKVQWQRGFSIQFNLESCLRMPEKKNTDFHVKQGGDSQSKGGDSAGTNRLSTDSDTSLGKFHTDRNSGEDGGPFILNLLM